MLWDRRARLDRIFATGDVPPAALGKLRASGLGLRV